MIAMVQGVTSRQALCPLEYILYGSLLINKKDIESSSLNERE
jgi:hypothetical protein